MRDVTRQHLGQAFGEIEQARGEFWSAEADKIERAQELERASAEHRTSVVRACGAANILNRVAQVAHDQAFTRLAEGESAVSGKNLPEFAEAVLVINGMDPVVAEQEVRVLEGLVGQSKPIPALIGGDVTILGGKTSHGADGFGNQLSAVNVERTSLSFRIDGQADVFTKLLANADSPWYWRRPSTHSPVHSLSAIDLVMTDDPERAREVAEAKRGPLIAVGYLAVEAVLDKEPESPIESDHREAVKFLLQRAMNVQEAEDSWDAMEMSEAYMDVLQKVIIEGSLGVSNDSAKLPNLPAALHPSIYDFIDIYGSGRQDVIASALIQNNFNQPKGGRIFDHLAPSPDKTNLLLPLKELLDVYPRILSNGDHPQLKHDEVSETQLLLLARVYAQTRQEQMVDDRGRCAKKSKEYRTLQRIVDNNRASAILGAFK